MLIHWRVAQALLAVAGGKDRASLGGLHVREDGAVEATDGHVMLKSAPDKISDSLTEDFPKTDSNGMLKPGTIIPRDALTKLIAVAKKAGKFTCLSNIKVTPGKDENVCLEASSDCEMWNTLKTKPLDGPFPNTDGLKQKEPVVIDFIFSLKVMRELTKALEAITDGDDFKTNIHFKVRGPLLGVEVELTSDAGNTRVLHGLAMPMRK